MKGVIFTEFMEMVEKEFGLMTADKVIQAVNPDSDGIYTAVGTYPCSELVSMIVELSQQTSQPIPELVHAFGFYLFGRLFNSHPEMVNQFQSTFELLPRLDDTIHAEVRKLYDQTELPHFECVPQGDNMQLKYRSPRGLPDLAEGLLEGCAAHFNEQLEISRLHESDGGKSVDFLVRVIG